MLGKSNPYWGNILKAVEIKNEITWDISELKKWQEAINHAVVTHWIAHGLRGAESKVYRYFKSKIAFLWKIDNNFKQIVLDWEKEFIEHWRDWSQFYWTLLKFTWSKKILWLRVRTIKNKSPNFYIKLTQKVLKDIEHDLFTKDFYDIIKSEEEIRKNEAEARKNEAEARRHKERAKMLEKVTNALRNSL
jgi:hypothetical protein